MAAPARLRSLLCAALLCAAGITIAAAQSAPADSAPAAGAGEATPGIPLPANGLVWILAPAAKPELSRLYVHSAAADMHRGKNFARSAFFLDVAVTVDLPGTSAKTRTDSHTPVLLVRKTTDEQEAQDSRSVGNEPVNQYHLVLLRLEAVGPNRVVYGFKTNPIAGKPKLVADEVPILTEQIAGGEWRKITPQQPLADGEYALSFMNEGTDVSSDVYDFGVGPAPPAKKP
jgi:hypothetical protein